ncbi:MAG: type II toxin-antitoxin system VapC family toxin [Planctomycetes bacterium]|nr:type II toxin-antitoxin system VapC family toxin [Planctomycetota bacterium]
MILDSSALVAILLGEPGSRKLSEKVSSARGAGIGVPTLTETAIVLSARLGHDARPLVSRFLVESGVVTVPFGDAHFGVAVAAWLRFGKGRHPAGLNFGDCMAYAVAKVAGEPLLCVGEDFPRTDLPLA